MSASPAAFSSMFSMAPPLLPLLLGLVAAPLAGGLVIGLDRRLTARLQGRLGPPILQPFFDVLKLLGKSATASSPWPAICGQAHLMAAATATTLFFMGGDLLLVLFVQAAAAAFLAGGALAAASPYSHAGGQREVLQMAAYEPLLLLTVAGLFLETGSFKVSDIFAFGTPLLPRLPLLYLALGLALTIKLRKSPLDTAASAHAHQELVRGVYTEYSGPFLGLVEIAHWYETALILGLVALFWASSAWGMLLLVAVTWLAEIVLDNLTARLTWRWMLGKVWAVGLALCLVNLLWLRWS